MHSRSVLKKYNFTVLTILGIICCLCFPYGLSAQKTSVRSGDWTAGSTWSGNSAPAAGSNVIISSGHVVSINTTIANNPNSVTIQNGGILIVSGTSGQLVINGNLSVLSSQGGSLIVSAGARVNVVGDADITGATVFVDGPNNSQLIVGRKLNHGIGATSDGEIYIDYTGLTAGQLNSAGTNTIYKQTGGTLELTATTPTGTDADFIVGGDVTIDNSGANITQPSTIYFTHPGKISIPAGSTDFYNIICEGEVDATGAGIDINIAGKLTLNANGSLNISNNTLTFLEGATVSGNAGDLLTNYSANNSIKINTGAVRYISTDFAIGTYTFPISIGSTYLGASTHLNSTGGTEIVVRPINTSPDYEITARPYTYLSAYWDISCTGVIGTVDINFLTDATATDGTNTVTMPTPAVVATVSSPPNNNAVAAEAVATTNTTTSNAGFISGAVEGVTMPFASNYWTIAEIASDDFYSLNSGNWENASGNIWTHSNDHSNARVVPAGRKPRSTSKVVIASGHEIELTSEEHCWKLYVGARSNSGSTATNKSGIFRINNISSNNASLTVSSPGPDTNPAAAVSNNSTFEVINSGKFYTNTGNNSVSNLPVENSSKVNVIGANSLVQVKGRLNLLGGATQLNINNGGMVEVQKSGTSNDGGRMNIQGLVSVESGGTLTTDQNVNIAGTNTAELRIIGGTVNIGTLLSLNGNRTVSLTISEGVINVADSISYHSGSSSIITISGGIIKTGQISNPGTPVVGLLYTQSGGVVELTPTNPNKGFENPIGATTISGGTLCFKSAGLIDVVNNTRFHDIVCDAPVTARKSNMNLSILRTLALTSATSSFDIANNTLTFIGNNSKVVSGDTITLNTDLTAFDINRAILLDATGNLSTSGKVRYINMSSPKVLTYPIVVNQGVDKYLLGMSASFASGVGFSNAQMEVSPVAMNPNVSGATTIDAYWRTNTSGIALNPVGVAVPRLDFYFSETCSAGLNAGKIYETTVPMTIRPLSSVFEKRGASDEYRYIEAIDLTSSQIDISNDKIWTIIAASQTTVRNGRWSDPLTWETGVAPTSNDDVTIRGHIVYTGLYDNSVDLLGASQYALPEEDVVGVDNTKPDVSRLCKSLTIENDALTSTPGALIIGNEAPVSTSQGRRTLYFGDITNSGNSAPGANILLNWDINSFKNFSINSDVGKLGGLYIMTNSTNPNGFVPHSRALNLINSGSVYNASFLEIGEDCD